jgi:hypothetical protein
MSIFTIDFFELSFLAEACIPPCPIARTMFWHRLIDEIYNQLTVNERARMFEWMQRNSSFDLENEDCQWFYARFNPNNQFDVSFGKSEVIQCFRRDDTYWIARNVSVNPEYIKSVVKTFPD